MAKLTSSEIMDIINDGNTSDFNEGSGDEMSYSNNGFKVLNGIDWNELDNLQRELEAGEDSSDEETIRVDTTNESQVGDIRSYGKEGDSGIFNKSSISQMISTGEYFPSPEKLPDSNVSLPLVHIGDEAFCLDRHMMCPYSRIETKKDYQKTIFNYRHSRTRRTTENSFGLLSQIFRIFYTPIPLKTETVDNLVLTACCFHNLLRNCYLEKTNYYYYNFDDNKPQPSENMMSLARTGGYTNFEGFFVKDEFKNFFNSSQGAVPCVATVQSAFHESLVQDDDVNVKNYVLAYQELCKFCSQLGGLFGFVVNDLEDKIGFLSQLVTEDEQNCSTVQSMITHEFSKDLVFSGRSGSITLLRLNRGLEFIILFMSKLVNLKPNDSTTHCAQEAYNQTLARHHSWIIRNGALFAMNFLPCQKALYDQILGNAPTKETLDTMPEMISKASMVHERVNNLLLGHDILNIP
ncbi:hypothetical protein QTP88_003459 [Uroleucon formosanum]